MNGDWLQSDPMGDSAQTVLHQEGSQSLLLHASHFCHLLPRGWDVCVTVSYHLITKATVGCHTVSRKDACSLPQNSGLVLWNPCQLACDGLKVLFQGI